MTKYSLDKPHVTKKKGRHVTINIDGTLRAPTKKIDAADERGITTHRGQSVPHETPVHAVKSSFLRQREDGTWDSRLGSIVNDITQISDLLPNEPTRDATCLVHNCVQNL